MTFQRFPASLDPDEPLGKKYVFPILLAEGVSITSATIDVMDASSTIVDPTPIVVITEVAWGLDNIGLTDNLWGVSFRARGTGLSGLAYVRCRYAKSSGPDGDDITGVIRVQQR